MAIGIPSVSDRDNPSSVLSNVLEDRLREIKVLLGRITPASWWAEVSGSDDNGAREAPLGIIHTPKLKTGATAEAIVEKSCAQCCSVGPIPLAVQVSISTSSTYIRQLPNTNIEVTKGADIYLYVWKLHQIYWLTQLCKL